MSIPRTIVGASLLAKAVAQTMKMLNVPAPSRAGSLPQVFVATANSAYTTESVGLRLLAIAAQLTTTIPSQPRQKNKE
ncbi:hypothetical protein PspS49_18445 [Pseudomonas sp. S49]|nr:hypothetical protein PspS49_18445 [Pseudomonas sp. S49]